MKLRTPILFIIITVLLSSSCNRKQMDPEKPNIIWITSEDNSVHYMKLFDEHGAETPHISSLAEQGLTFLNAYSNAPVCSVARSTLITGCFAPRIGAQYHRKIQTVPMPDSLYMFPAYLKAAGYYTSNNSKEDYNLYKGKAVWDESSKHAHWRNRAEGQPFFHVQNIEVTHESSVHFKETNKASTTDRIDSFIFPNHPSTDIFQYTNDVYRAKIVSMDEQVGRIIQELKADDLLEKTFIFYFGDNGGVLPGSKGYIYESGVHIPLVVRIPEKYKHLVDFDKGSKVHGFVSFIDLGPSVLSLAGVDIPVSIDGKSFLGQDIHVKDVDNRNIVFSYADRFDEKYDFVRAVRKGNFKYIRSYMPFNFDALMNNYRYKQLAYQEWLDLYKMNELNEVQSAFFLPRPAELLFDLANDPYETYNLADNPNYHAILSELRTAINDWVLSMPDLSFYPEAYLIENAFNDPVNFGQQHKQQIEEYVRIANLQLEEFTNVKNQIKEALLAPDPWKRYWGLIDCCTFGNLARDLESQIRKISQNDPELLNRVRALEYMGLTGLEDIAPAMTSALYQSNSAAEALLIMNITTLMKDGDKKYVFNIDANKVPSEVKKTGEVNWRLEYLCN